MDCDLSKFYGTRLTSFPGTTLTRFGGAPSSHLLATSLDSAMDSSVALSASAGAWILPRTLPFTWITMEMVSWINALGSTAVSYTHLTLPTKRIV